MTRSEFDLIETYFTPRIPPGSDVLLGVGDDAAVISIPEGHVLVTATDSLVCGTHFFPDADPYSLGLKAVAVNLSDFAAMGATPAWINLALTLPQMDEAWIQAMSRGLFDQCQRYGLQLVGGDTARGPLNITITLQGYAQKMAYLQRSTAQAHHDIYVTGTLGDAAFALKQLQSSDANKNKLNDFLYQRLHEPEPRLTLGQALVPIASACIDISDGLVADLSHILRQSKLGAELWVKQLPLSQELKQQTATQQREIWELALTGGEDYELCFTAAPEKQDAIQQLTLQHHCPISHIGVTSLETGVRCLLPDGKRWELTKTGFQHF